MRVFSTLASASLLAVQVASTSIHQGLALEKYIKTGKITLIDHATKGESKDTDTILPKNAQLLSKASWTISVPTASRCLELVVALSLLALPKSTQTVRGLVENPKGEGLLLMLW
jgi:hypothetical protein